MRPAIEGAGILVTGGAGFIGSHLVDSLLDAGAREVVVIDNMFLGRPENLSEATARGAVLYRDDAEIASSLEAVFDRHDIDVVFNAATKALNYSFVNPRNAFDTNVEVVLNLLEAQRRGRFTTLCHFSTSEVYGTAAYEPMDEDHPRRPTTAYAAGKAAADLAVETWVGMFDLDAFIVRPFNNYGPRQNHEGYLAGVIPITIKRIVDGDTPEIHGTGRQTRDFIFVEDTTRAILDLYPVMEAGDSVNVSAVDQRSIESVITDICSAMDHSDEVARCPARSSDVECHVASIDKIRGLIDFRLTPWDEGLGRTIEWYRGMFTGDRS